MDYPLKCSRMLSKSSKYILMISIIDIIVIISKFRLAMVKSSGKATFLV